MAEETVAMVERYFAMAEKSVAVVEKNIARAEKATTKVEYKRELVGVNMVNIW